MPALRKEVAGLLAREEVDVLRLAFLLGRVEGRPVDLEAWERVMQRMARELRDRLRGEPDEDPAEVLNRYLFQDWGFLPLEEGVAGDVLLDEVFRRRRGVPEALAIPYLELGWRTGVPLAPVEIEGRLLIRSPSASGVRLRDLSRRGHALTPPEVAALLPGRSTAPDDLTALPPASERSLLVRLLRRLKGAYREADDLNRLEAASDLLLLLDPHSPEDRRDRGLVRLGRENLLEAKADLKRYLQLRPEAQDALLIQEYVEEIDRRMRSLSRATAARLAPPPDGGSRP